MIILYYLSQNGNVLLLVLPIKIQFRYVLAVSKSFPQPWIIKSSTDHDHHATKCINLSLTACCSYIESKKHLFFVFEYLRIGNSKYNLFG